MMTIHPEIRTAEDRGATAERKRIIGLVLALFARCRLRGDDRAAEILDVLATAIEHPTQGIDKGV